MPDKYEALSQLRITQQCPARWSHMVGDDQVRHCGKCDRNVYNVSAMTRDEALRVIEAHEGKMCMRFYSRPDGTVMTKDCGFIPKLKIKVGAALGALFGFTGFLAFPVFAQGGAKMSPAAEAKYAARSLAMGLENAVDGDAEDKKFAAMELEKSKERLRSAAGRMDEQER